MARFHPTAWELDGNSVVIQQAGSEKCVLAVAQQDFHCARLTQEPHGTGKHQFVSLRAVGQFDELLADQFQSKLHGEASGQTEITIESGVYYRGYRDCFPATDNLGLGDGRHANYHQ